MYCVKRLILNMQAEASCSLMTWLCSFTPLTTEPKKKPRQGRIWEYMWGGDCRCKPLLTAVTKWKRRRDNEWEEEFAAIRSWDTDIWQLWRRMDGSEAVSSPSAFIKLICHTSVKPRWKLPEIWLMRLRERREWGSPSTRASYTVGTIWIWEKISVY